MDPENGTSQNPEQRNAHTQNAFREVNEAITGIGEDLGLGRRGGQPMTVMCECGSADCFERIEISRTEYEAVRADGAHFVLVPGHEVGRVEHVVARSLQYVVAQNHGDAEPIARDNDPRR
jgi:hypothetical protein